MGWTGARVLRTGTGCAETVSVMAAGGLGNLELMKVPVSTKAYLR